METNRFHVLLSKVSGLVLGGKNTYRLRYYRQRKRWPNLKHPKDISEILIASMFSPEAASYADLVDKVRVRDYIRQKGLSDILLKHYGEWENPEDIDFDSLPDKFILKANNGSGGHVICKDKVEFDKQKAIEKLKANLKEGQEEIEPHYRYIKPLVFCEELIDTGTDEFPTDYKFTCINGEIADVFVATERRTSARYSTLDLNWEPLPYTKKEYLPKYIPPRPAKFEEMIDIAKKLSKDFKFVRVDLYEYNNHVYFSELTFYPWGSMMYSYTDEAIKLYGEKYRMK